MKRSQAALSLRVANPGPGTVASGQVLELRAPVSRYSLARTSTANSRVCSIGGAGCSWAQIACASNGPSRSEPSVVRSEEAGGSSARWQLSAPAMRAARPLGRNRFVLAHAHLRLVTASSEES